jgi:hypothetical protein
VRWLISRFSAADRPGWTAPADDELRQHVDDRFLAVVPDLVAQLSRAAADLRTDLVVIGQAPLEAQVQLAGVRYVAAVDARPPYRLLGLQGFPRSPTAPSLSSALAPALSLLVLLAWPAAALLAASLLITRRDV